MTLDADRQNELDHTWMDSLLHEALTNDSDREQARINALFAKPEFDSPEPNSTVDRRFSSRARWLPIAIAASPHSSVATWTAPPSVIVSQNRDRKALCGSPIAFMPSRFLS